MRIPGREVVRGDQLILHEGDRVPADATVTAATNLAVDESLLSAILFIPPLRDLFKLAMPHPDDLLIVAVAGLSALLWMEVVKRAAAFEGSLRALRYRNYSADE